MKKMFKKFFPVALVAGLAYYLYSSVISSPQAKTSAPDIIITTVNKASQVLGAATKKVAETASNVVEKVTDEQEEALINSTVENITKHVKDLPASQTKKIKTQFCSDVIQEAVQEATMSGDPR